MSEALSVCRGFFHHKPVPKSWGFFYTISDFSLLGLRGGDGHTRMCYISSFKHHTCLLWLVTNISASRSASVPHILENSFDQLVALLLLSGCCYFAVFVNRVQNNLKKSGLPVMLPVTE